MFPMIVCFYVIFIKVAPIIAITFLPSLPIDYSFHLNTDV